MTEDKKEKKDNLKQFTDTQKEEIRKITQALRIPQAPPPITPLSGLGYVPPKTSNPKTLEPQKEFTVSITGTELMKKWSVGWEAIFDWARQEKLTPYEPKRFRTCINDDLGYLTDNADERASYFSRWLYHPTGVEAFGILYENIIDEWRKKVVSKEDKETPAANFFTRENRAIWRIGFEGKEEPIQHLMGLQYIGYLLKKPGTSISCIELYQTATGGAPDNIMSEGTAIGEGLNVGSSKQVISDPKAKDKHISKYMELENDLLKINDLPDWERTPQHEMLKKEIENEMAAILPYLKERNFADPNDIKAQSNIGKRLDTAYEAISKANMEKLAKHLQHHIKPDGAFGLSYTGTLTWKITIK